MTDPYIRFLQAQIERRFYERHFPVVGFNPLPMQEKFLASTAKVSVFSGGNRAGKTSGGAFKAACLANGILGRFYPGFPKNCEPTRGLVSALDYKLAQPVRRKLEAMLGDTILQWREKDSKYILHNGSEIHLKSEESGEQKYQADNFDWAWKDEAGDMRAEGIYNEIMRSLVDTDGPFFMTMTPTLGTSWCGPKLYEPWSVATGDKSGEVANGVTFFFADTDANYFLSKRGLKSFLDQLVTDEQIAVRKHGRFVTLEGLVYSMFRTARHVIDPIPIPLEWPRYRGMDFGLDAPSTCVFGAVEPPTDKEKGCACPAELRPHSKPRLHIYDEVYDNERGHIIKGTCEKIKAKSEGQTFRRTVLDPSCWNETGGPDAIGGHFVVAHEYERHGIFVDKANNDVQKSVERLWAWLGTEAQEPQMVVHRNCANLIKEMRGQRWARVHGAVLLGGNRGGMGDKINKTDSDHGIDALRYLANCEPLGGGFSMTGPDEDPFPVREWDPMEDEQVRMDAEPVEWDPR